MKTFIKENETILISIAIIAGLFLTTAVVALMFNEVTPASLLKV